MFGEPASTLLPPALALLGGLLAFAPATIPHARQHALTACLAIALLALLAAFYSPGWSPALAVLLALIIAAPLLDRARFFGLVVGALVGMGFIHYCIVSSLPTFLPIVPHTLHVLVGIAGASLLGLIGSACMEIHPARAKLRAPVGPIAMRAAGYVLLTLTVVTLAQAAEALQLHSLVLAGLTGALLSLLWARYVHHPQPLLRVAQGLLAGVLTALMLPEDQELALTAGALAAVLVAQGESAAHALRLDDPAQVIPTLLLPSLLGVALPGIYSFAVLADHLRWLGAALGLAMLVALALWPALMLTLGLAASSRKVREGLDFRD